MKVTREELDDTYRSKETDELAALYREGTLTEVAKASCKAVLVERGVDEEALREMEREAAPKTEELWVAMHYKIKRGDQEFGPYSLEDLKRYVTEGRIAATDLAKSEGMEDWAPISVVTARDMGFPHQGDASAQYSLGVMYEVGKGVPQDYAEAVKWYRLAAEQGNALAQNSMGVMYVDGLGVPQDYAEAARWHRLAAEQGHSLAQYSLGVMYEVGQGVPQDYAEAANWFRLAAEQGNRMAQISLGFMYEEGKGVVQDDAEARKWATLAEAQYQKHSELRDTIAEKLTRGNTIIYSGYALDSRRPHTLWSATAATAPSRGHRAAVVGPTAAAHCAPRGDGSG